MNVQIASNFFFISILFYFIYYDFPSDINGLSIREIKMKRREFVNQNGLNVNKSNEFIETKTTFYFLMEDPCCCLCFSISELI
jgi:hypothetical protein